MTASRSLPGWPCSTRSSRSASSKRWELLNASRAAGRRHRAAGVDGEERMRLKAAVRKFLETERVCRAATAGPDGTPHVVPVCHVLAEGKIYFATDKESQKARNLRRNPRLALA